MSDVRDKLRRKGQAPQGNGLESAAVEDRLAGQLPVLWSFLSATEHVDGTARETGTILVFVEGGLVKACVRDREVGEVAFVTGVGLENLLGRIEQGLDAGSLDWRAERQKGRR